jgi:hypothetical protein
MSSAKPGNGHRLHDTLVAHAQDRQEVAWHVNRLACALIGIGTEPLTLDLAANAMEVILEDFEVWRGETEREREASLEEVERVKNASRLRNASSLEIALREHRSKRSSVNLTCHVTANALGGPEPEVTAEQLAETLEAILDECQELERQNKQYARELEKAEAECDQMSLLLAERVTARQHELERLGDQVADLLVENERLRSVIHGAPAQEGTAQTFWDVLMQDDET